MHKTPPEEDEQSEDSQTSYPTQQRNTVKRPRKQQASYHSDEHPEIPKVRRASLYLEQKDLSPAPAEKQEPAPPPTTMKQARALPPPVSKRARVLPTTPSKRISSSTSQKTRVERIEEDEQEQNKRTQSSKILVAQRRRSTVYEPPPTSPRVRHKRREISGLYPLTKIEPKSDCNLDRKHYIGHLDSCTACWQRY